MQDIGQIALRFYVADVKKNCYNEKKDVNYMDFGISTKVLWEYSLKEAISIAGELNYDVIELWIDDIISSGLKADEIVGLTEKYGLKRAVHLRTDDLNIASFNEGIRRESLEQTKRGIQMASEIEANEATLHPGRKTSKTNSVEEAWEVQLNSIKELAKTAEFCGVTLCVEGMEKISGEFVLTPNDLGYVINECKNDALGVTIDISHLQTIGDAVSILKESKNLPVCNVHISQTTAHALHLPLFAGEGDIDYKKIFTELKSFYNGSVVVEGYKKGMGEEIAEKSIKWYKDITKEVFEGE